MVDLRQRWATDGAVATPVAGAVLVVSPFKVVLWRDVVFNGEAEKEEGTKADDTVRAASKTLIWSFMVACLLFDVQ